MLAVAMKIIEGSLFAIENQCLLYIVILKALIVKYKDNACY
jgi:hypothetical protein